MNIFNIIPGNFFNILSSKNKEIYFDCLKILHSLYESKMGFDITKEEAMEALLEYFDDSEKESFDSDEGDKITSRERANYVLDKLEQTGWIVVETSNDYVNMISFRFYSITVLEALNRICYDTNDEIFDYEEISPFEYKGYLYSIYILLNNREHVEYGTMLQQVHRLASEFVSEIKKINLKLKDYIDNISKHSDLRDLMELLIDYKNQLVDKAYQRLKTHDNINRYKNRIIDKLEKYSEDAVIMNEIAKDYVNHYNLSFEIANMYAENFFNDVIDIFYNLDELIDEIELKNKVYVNSTITKIKFLLNNETDVLGKLNYILKTYTKHNLNENRYTKKLEQLFSISNQIELKNESLYTPKEYHPKMKISQLPFGETPDLSDLQDQFLKDFDMEYSEEKIINYVNEVLKITPAIKASSLFAKTPSEEELLRLLYILVYASTSENYSINNINKKFESDEFILNDFEIARR